MKSQATRVCQRLGDGIQQHVVDRDLVGEAAPSAPQLPRDPVIRTLTPICFLDLCKGSLGATGVTAVTGAVAFLDGTSMTLTERSPK